MIEDLRFALTAVFLCLGVGSMLASIGGIFRFGFVLDRMQSAAVTDTLGVLCLVIALMIASGSMAFLPKLLLILVLLWFGSPISSHLVSKLEVETDPELTAHVKEEERG